MPANYLFVAHLLLFIGLPIASAQSLVVQPLLASHEQTQAENPESLVIDLSTQTGPVLHGAAGWLYGQSAPGIPTVSIMEPLQPQLSAQKPDGGAQHPMADASLVVPSFRAAGGKLMQIYMQDIYPDWTYNDFGIEEYLGRVDTMTRQIVASPYHEVFVYAPFNEPNNNWYADNGPKFTKFLHDWMLVYRKIRTIDPGAKIAGPGFEHFNSLAFETFLRFAQQNNVLPDEFTWHELHDDFFSQWYQRVDQYRNSEKKLGIGPLPIVINEYGRDRGDLAVPGSLVQWITRLEDSKVYGCLAFWTPSGTLADLAARIWPNRPTGAWWLYRWYGAMGGNTVRVTSPDPQGIGLQGLAALDAARQQVRMIFGGTAKPIRVEVHGLEQIAAFQNGVHVSLLRIASSGIEPSPGPEIVSEANQTVAGRRLVVSVPAGTVDTAYSLVLTPTVAASSIGRHGQQFMAVEADFNARAVYSDPRGSMVVLGASSTSGDEKVRFVVSAPSDGYYSLGLRYAADHQSTLQLRVDDEAVRMLRLTPQTGRDWGGHTQQLFLAAGVHRFRFSLFDTHAQRPLSLHSLTFERVAGQVDRYDASSRDNLLGGTAHAIPTQGAESVQAVTGIGQGASNFLEFRHVRAKTSGEYAVVVTYANGEMGHKGQVDEQTEISVNGASTNSLWFRNTFSDTVFATTVFTVRLKPGDNRIRFASTTGRAPIVASIHVAKEAP